MNEVLVHEGEPGFDDFVEEVMTLLGHRAQQRGICIDCLTDRLVIEMVAGLARTGVPASDILSLVADGFVEAEEDESEDGNGWLQRIHGPTSFS